MINPFHNQKKAFVPSDIIAAVKTEAPSSLTDSSDNHHNNRFLSWRWPIRKKMTIVVVILFVLLISAVVVVFYHNEHAGVKGGVFISKRTSKPVPKNTLVASTLTGLPVGPSINQHPVTGIMIENSTDARPQSGLDQAGVVFEAIAEGGITRFLTLYQDTQPTYIGPVRSARPYYVQWCMGFDCALAHAGGSPEALSDIQSWGTKNLDQFANGDSYERITSRYAPHNLYTSMSQLNQLESTKGYGAAHFNGFKRKADQPYSAAPATNKTTSDTRTPTTSIDFAISSADYNAHFDYNAKTNNYLRSQAGAPHTVIDESGNQSQITPKVVIAMIMQYGLEADDHHSQYNVVGNGQAFVFQDGTVTQATWEKGSTTAPLTFKDAHGVTIALNAGQTWLTALAAPNLVTYH